MAKHIDYTRIHKITRSKEGGIFRVQCSCGHAFTSDRKHWVEEWERDHLEQVDLSLRAEHRKASTR